MNAFRIIHTISARLMHDLGELVNLLSLFGALVGGELIKLVNTLHVVVVCDKCWLL